MIRDKKKSVQSRWNAHTREMFLSSFLGYHMRECYGTQAGNPNGARSTAEWDIWRLREMLRIQMSSFLLTRQMRSCQTLETFKQGHHKLVLCAINAGCYVVSFQHCTDVRPLRYRTAKPGLRCLGVLTLLSVPWSRNSSAVTSRSSLGKCKRYSCLCA
jgi:hypothetical protein